jgi:hypothetical protein
MLVYWTFSPQDRLTDLSVRIARSRQVLLHTDESEIREVLALSAQAMRLSLARLGLVIIPTLAAIIPVGLLAWATDHAFHLSSERFDVLGVRGSFPGYLVFWIPLCLSAAATKFRFKIK